MGHRFFTKVNKVKFFKKNLWIVFLVLIAIIVIQLRILVSVFGFNFFIVSSGSMQPEIGVGDLIIVAPSNEYNIGDIVTYKSNNSYVTHRIREMNSDEIITQGDANTGADLPVSRSAVVGKCIGHIPDFKNILKYFSYIAIGAAVLMVGITVVSLIKDKD